MAFVLLIAGIGFLLVGLLAVGFGVPINEFSFGNTLILAGSVTACTGMMLIGLWAVVRELIGIAQRLGTTSVARSSSTASATLREPASGSEGFLFGGAQSVTERSADTEALRAPDSPLPWQDEAAARGRGEAPTAPSVAEPAPPKRRNLMFSSSSRKERERERANEKSAAPSQAALDEAPVEIPQSATFEDAWPQPERSRPAETSPRRASRAPSTFTEPAVGADRYLPAAPKEEPPVTVLKSGVVDGMAYSLYSDGSIEAQMPEGMMRFTSIDELRSHLDQRP